MNARPANILLVMMALLLVALAGGARGEDAPWAGLDDGLPPAGAGERSAPQRNQPLGANAPARLDAPAASRAAGRGAPGDTGSRGGSFEGRAGGSAVGGGGMAGGASTDAGPAVPPAAVSKYEGKPIRRADAIPGDGAGGADTAAPADATATPAAGLSTSRLILALAVVLGLIFGLRYLARRAFPQAAGGRPTGAVRVLGRTSVAPRQQVMLLQVGRRVLVVGDSGGAMRSLAEISDPDEVASLIGQTQRQQQTTPTQQFATWLGAARNAFGRAVDHAATDDDATDDDATDVAAAAFGGIGGGGGFSGGAHGPGGGFGGGGVGGGGGGFGENSALRSNATGDARSTARGYGGQARGDRYEPGARGPEHSPDFRPAYADDRDATPADEDGNGDVSDRDTKAARSELGGLLDRVKTLSRQFNKPG